MAVKPTAALAKEPGPDPNHRVDIEPSPRRVRVMFNGETVADIPVAPLVEAAPRYERPYVASPEPPPKTLSPS